MIIPHNNMGASLFNHMGTKKLVKISRRIRFQALEFYRDASVETLGNESNCLLAFICDLDAISPHTPIAFMGNHE
jgi:hypothetical protein